MTNYQIITIGENHDPRRSLLLEELLSSEVLQPKLETKELLCFHNPNPGDSEMVQVRETLDVAIYFASKGDQTKHKIRIEKLRNSGVPIVPVVWKDDFHHDVLPEILQPIHAFTWKGPNSQKELTATILRILGLTPGHRGVFISYRRTDGYGIADQLYTALKKRQFQVYKDDYSNEYGYQFQKKLFESMDAMGFVVLIHSPQITESNWVRHEVNYAVANQLGIVLIVPDSLGVKPRYISENVEGLPDFKVNWEDLDTCDFSAKNYGIQRTLSTNQLDKLVDFIEKAHSERLYVRMRSIVDNVLETADFMGLESWREDEYTINLLNPKTSRSLRIRHVSSTPSSKDFYLLDRDMDAKQSKNGKKVILHRAEMVDEHHVEFIDWVLQGKPIGWDHFESIFTQIKSLAS